jgi:sugar-specific transcriptional regulator TrmB
LSLKRILRTLGDLGLTETESRAYIYLAKIGPSNIREVSNGLKMTRKQLYPALNSLKKKGIVTYKVENATIITAITFEDLLDLFLDLKIENHKQLKR